MRIIITVLSLCILLVLTRCGDEGWGFNIGKELPVTIPIELGSFGEIQDPNLPIPDSLTNVNPAPFNQSTTYDLNDVDDFQNEAICNVTFKDISYAIEGVEAGEDIGVESLQIVVSYNSQTLASLDIADNLPDGRLTNFEPTDISNLNRELVSQALKEGGTIQTEITFDFEEIPPSGFGFDFALGFDTVVKIRDGKNDCE